MPNVTFGQVCSLSMLDHHPTRQLALFQQALDEMRATHGGSH
jgi:hypothetical protein